jgi:hypothetical protein
MDDRLRELERKARAGDPDAAYRYFIEVGRTDDITKQYEAMMLLFDAQNPGWREQMHQIQEISDMLEEANRQIEDPPIQYEFWISDNTLGDATNQRLGSQIVTTLGPSEPPGRSGRLLRPARNAAEGRCAVLVAKRTRQDAADVPTGCPTSVRLGRTPDLVDLVNMIWIVNSARAGTRLESDGSRLAWGASPPRSVGCDPCVG